jgi:hypothetical protein
MLRTTGALITDGSELGSRHNLPRTSASSTIDALLDSCLQRKCQSKLLTRLNDSQLKAMSLSLVLRGHCRSGINNLRPYRTAIHGRDFANARTLLCCDQIPVDLRGQAGVVAAAKRLGNVVARFNGPNGKPRPREAKHGLQRRTERSMLNLRTAIGIGRVLQGSRRASGDEWAQR